jgi:YesN/AraC family two-component response regulator
LEKNGEKGFSTAISKIPDIIISDIMMPLMNGYEMVKRLKEDIRTSHIPVIFLTAKVDMESRLEGLEYGAEAYLTKPFHQQELFIRIKKLLEIRQQLYQRYSTAIEISETKNPAIQKEDTFMLKLRDILVHNLHNEEYGIREICREMGVSRAQLYRKFNALTNISVSRYIKSLKLNRAKELLLNEDLNVSDVAYQVGFKNLSHFSTSFYKEFGYRPSEKKSNI